jgi:hypothetical protein
MKERHTSDLAAASRAPGRPLVLLERAQNAWCWRWLDDGLWDLRYALRMWRQHPAFTAVGCFGCFYRLARGGFMSAAQLTTTVRGWDVLRAAVVRNRRPSAAAANGAPAIVGGTGNSSRGRDASGPLHHPAMQKACAGHAWMASGHCAVATRAPHRAGGTP